MTNTAYFDLTGLELPDSLELLRKAFGETVEIGYAETGDPNVKLTRDVMGPITLCEGIGAFTLDLGGRMISGTRGADGADGEAGCRGGPAIAVASDTAITVRDDSAIPGAVRGGKGGWGNPPGEGGAAIVDKQGRPVSVSGRQDLVVPGAQGTPPKGGALFLVKWADGRDVRRPSVPPRDG